ncbi:PqqD family protein [Natrarchaeobius chitinivorans]|uniref:PqqD family protein n=1 Tax=Natrarchaeobius chitinivorans TaxID=1679083 RepID=A0A3N6P5Q0_NATCH|nr:PqqD family protein [Natrarchaeobius chitinivorans]RQG90975.1 PqqD family protein [Natrarchaeobius chitinivorans]
MGETNVGELSDSAEVVATDDHLATTIDGEAVILHLESGQYYGLNGVASSLWDSLQQPRTVAQLREYVSDEYDVSPEECTGDIDSILADFSEAGLVEIEPDREE